MNGSTNKLKLHNITYSFSGRTSKNFKCGAKFHLVDFKETLDIFIPVLIFLNLLILKYVSFMFLYLFLQSSSNI